MQRKGLSVPRERAASATASLVLDLLAFAAGESTHKDARWKSQDDEGIGRQALRYVSKSGLAPLLHAAVQPYLERLPKQQRDELIAAELTALVRHSSMTGAAGEVVMLCRELQVPVTLLKGVSISSQHYRAGHLRPTGDIDVLVSGRDRPLLQSALLERGFWAEHGEWSRAAHAAPLCHPESSVWVEVHDTLFPKDSELLTKRLFGSDLISAQSLPFEFQGLPVRRLSDELQLVYIASYWIRDLSMHAVHPSFLVPLLDAIVLLRNATIDWKGMLEWMDNEAALASLYVMLSWLARHGLAGSSAAILPRLASRQERVGNLELWLIHAMLDRWLLRGVPPALGGPVSRLWAPLMSHRPLPAKLVSIPWKISFPQGNADRYTARRLLRIAKRSVERLRVRP